MREANLRQQLSCSRALVRCSGDAAVEDQVSRRIISGSPTTSSLFHRKWTLDFRRCGRKLECADSVQDAIPLRFDDARYGGGAEPRRLRGSVDGSGIGIATNSRRHGQRHRVKDIYRACENLRSHGIRACFFLQFGYPGETWNEIEETIRMVRETRPDDIGVSVSYPLPGTRFHRRVSAQLGQKSNWSDSADLAMMFRGELFERILPGAGRCSARRSSRRFPRRRRCLGPCARAETRSVGVLPRITRLPHPARIAGAGVMRLLLTHAYFLSEDPKERQIMKPYAPLGILYLSSYLRGKGFRRRDLRFHFRLASRSCSAFWTPVRRRLSESTAT